MPNRKNYPRIALVLLVLGFIAFSAINTLLFGRLRIDFTEGALYTVSDGTREIIAGIGEPIDMYFFFSDKATREAAPLRVACVNCSRSTRTKPTAGSVCM